MYTLHCSCVRMFCIAIYFMRALAMCSSSKIAVISVVGRQIYPFGTGTLAVEKRERETEGVCYSNSFLENCKDYKIKVYHLLDFCYFLVI